MSDFSGAGHPDSSRSRPPEEEAKAAAEIIRLGSPPQVGSRSPVEERGYRLYLPRPASLAVLFWVWLGVSAIYVGLGAVAAYLRFFRVPEKEADFPLVVPGAIAARFWPYLGIVVLFNVLRCFVMVGGLRSKQASVAVRLGWMLGVASSLLHLADYFWGIVPGITATGAGSTTPAPVAAWAGVSLVLAFAPPILGWVWRPAEVFVPDWTYGEGRKRPTEGALRRSGENETPEAPGVQRNSSFSGRGPGEEGLPR